MGMIIVEGIIEAEYIEFNRRRIWGDRKITILSRKEAKLNHLKILNKIEIIFNIQT